jgi:DNA primase
LAGPISEEILAEILSRANIVEVIDEHLTLRKVGSGYQGLCPFHSDSKPSFHVNEARQFFHCFGCGAGGNAFHFLMRFHHMTFPEAVQTLATRYGVQLPQRSPSPEERRRKAQRDALQEINDLAVTFFRKVLLGSKGMQAIGYLDRRGISPETQEAFSLGLSPSGWRALVNFLSEKSVSLSIAERAGLIISGKDGGYYDRFRGRLMFPIHDERGRVVGFGGRAMGEEPPKYLNSPDSPVFEKRKNLYGLYIARGPIREADTALVVEGYTDLLALHQYGIRNAVATLGTALTEEHLLMLKRFTPKVIHVFDADEAGDRATMRALDLCLKVRIRGRVLRLPARHDPDSYVRKVGAAAFRAEVENAISLTDYLINRVSEREDISQLEGKTKALEQLIPYIRRLPDRVSIDHYASVVSERLRIAEARIHEMIKEGAEAVHSRIEKQSPNDPYRAERLLLQAVLKEPSLAGCLQSDVLEEFQDPKAKALGAHMARWVDEGIDRDRHSLKASIQDLDLAQALSQLFMNLEAVEQPDRICEDCIKHIRRKGLERKIHALEEEIVQARNRRDDDRIRILEDRKVDLILQKARLKLSA